MVPQKPVALFFAESRVRIEVASLLLSIKAILLLRAIFVLIVRPNTSGH